MEIANIYLSLINLINFSPYNKHNFKLIYIIMVKVFGYWYYYYNFKIILHYRVNHRIMLYQNMISKHKFNQNIKYK